MALSHLLKLIYNNGNEELIRRGKKITAYGQVEMIEHSELSNSITFRVKDDAYNSFFKVYIQKYNNESDITLKCTCLDFVQNGLFCRHQIASLFQLQEMLDKNMLHNNTIVYRQLHTTVKMKTIDQRIMRSYTSPEIYSRAEAILQKTKCEIISSANERVEAVLRLGDSEYPLIIQKNDERNFDTSCTCAETEYALCEHKIVLFLQILQEHGSTYFDTIRNLDRDKNKLLAIYGYSLNDDIEGKFEFVIKEGRPFLKVLDPSIKRVANPNATVSSINATNPFKGADVNGSNNLGIKKLKLGVVFNFNHDIYPYFKIDAVQGEPNDEYTKFLGAVEKLDLTKFIELNKNDDDDKVLLPHLRKLQESEIQKYLSLNSPFHSPWETIEDRKDLSEESKKLVDEYLLPKLKKIRNLNHSNHFIYYLPQGQKFETKNLKELSLSADVVKPNFSVTVKDNNHIISAGFETQYKKFNFSENESTSPMLFLKDGALYFYSRFEDISMLSPYYPYGQRNIDNSEWSIVQDSLIKNEKYYNITYDKKLVKEIKNLTPEVKLMLKEMGEYLIFEPKFTYDGVEEKGAYKPIITIAKDGKINRIHRNEKFEKNALENLRSLHSNFIDYDDGRSLALKGNDVIKNNWFFNFIDQMKEKNIPVFGFDFLNSYRFNTNRPNTRIHVSSGLDWFDAKVDIDFGGQKVSIAEIKKALANKQTVVALSDGTLGILPEEWIKKYSLLFKVGEGNKNATNLKLSKYHLGVIDQLYEERNEEEISFALDEKFERIKHFKKIPEETPKSNINKVLRPYQLAGFQWLNYLSKVGWGGILADDMGLGKTIQSLSMLQEFAVSEGKLLALVVCPTTLLYNWQNEINKFTPDLSYLIHHGTQRSKKETELSKYNIIITTYGTLRSDIELFLKVHFDYVILDESQAIKNPTSKVTKAATLLNATNKICMSGTPLQNNTFDIYAQMNFLNPGLLGSIEYFRNEFATPIDKFGEKDQKVHLRKILFPFILRRTKEQVAKDLPPKTEQILFCEMGEEQRSIYDAYRNSFRDKILGVIEEQGIEKSQLSILQGLMKLRQICDSPAILNEEEKFPNVSVKLEELIREITENIGEHKALIFSQFLGMLALIKEKLKSNKINFEYFDGSTNTTDRQKAIDNFQNNNDCRVFLISLKAGGVGLNLTAADYVYIVDPWWNPAVEQQAIDRTHRIGQTKSIFAYRMICKDSIEDKILQLQERKKNLAKDIVSDDSETGFIKNLTKEDIEYLLS